MPDKVKLRDVFGVGREMPLNYTPRDAVDTKFIESLSRDKHVVIYGSSKQGKTTLRKHCLNDDDYIVVSCLDSMSLDDLHASILKASGYRIIQTETKTVGGKWKYGVEFRGEGKVPFMGSASAQGTMDRENENQRSEEYKKLEIDLFDVNDVITALGEIKFSKFIVLEDFHYLPNETQRSFSFALKAFHENSPHCFIIVGVWREKNRLIYYNGDLTNRVVSIDVDLWSESDLRDVIAAGERLLNVEINPPTVNELLKHTFDSVSLVQEACFKLCETQNVFEGCDALTKVGEGADAASLVKQIVNDQAGRYSAFMTNFAEGFQQTEYEMYKWLAFAIVQSGIEELEKGLRRSQVASIIKGKHPTGAKLNEGNITQALQNAASLQVQKHIRPIIIDYDQTTRVLHVVDRSFLIWLAHQDQNELISELGITP